MSEGGRLVLAVALAFSIFVGWEYFLSKHRNESLNAEKARSVEKKTEQGVDSIASETTKNASGKLLLKQEEKSEIIKESPRISIRSPRLEGSISLLGLRFDDLVIKDHKKVVDSDEGVDWFLPEGIRGAHFFEFGWIDEESSIKLPSKDSLWASSDNSIEPFQPVSFIWDNGRGLIFKVVVEIDDGYMFKIEREIVNNTSQQIDLKEFERIVRYKNNAEIKRNYFFHDGVSATFEGKLFESDYAKIAKNKMIFNNIEFIAKDKKYWFGLSDKYWFTSVIPEIGGLSDLVFYGENLSYASKEIDGESRFIAENIGRISVAPGGNKIVSDYLFAGAKEIGTLDNYSEQMNIALFDRTVDFGRLYFITRPMFSLLRFLNSIFGNFGFSIMMLTIIVKIAMFPLVYRSLKSSYKSKKLQPEIEAIKKRYEGDRNAINIETMKVFRKHNVNPMSGCLPMLIQMPVFFSLYKVLYVTIEMRHAKFLGWIEDLSAPDPVNIFDIINFANFDLLPVFRLGIWPLIFGITMFIQQKMQPKPTDETQANLMKFFPFIFMFMFSNFPVGLIIYWTWNNILSTIQQLIVTRLIKV